MVYMRHEQMASNKIKRTSSVTPSGSIIYLEALPLLSFDYDFKVASRFSGFTVDLTLVDEAALFWTYPEPPNLQHFLQINHALFQWYLSHLQSHITIWTRRPYPIADRSVVAYQGHTTGKVNNNCSWEVRAIIHDLVPSDIQRHRDSSGYIFLPYTPVLYVFPFK